ncbi:alpha-adducin-like isoform X2 [Dendronephthya gigantea]|uniref:alpha-adducin-like isoform X2 n=1 Tax=Dendronephthya gigantea TaxID=151771 RepID=UPI00106AF595|nr:alpha-adducin-like isoform X2 [Dendronephthya gigantea]
MPEPTRTGGQHLTEMKARRYSEPAMGRRSVRRPEDIQRDVRGLKLRQRVSLVLKDEYLRHELEDTVRKHGEEGEELASVRTYQDFLVPTSNYYGAASGLSAVHPINDIRGTDMLNYTKSERILRCKLASVYRLIDHFGWTESVWNHSTVRCSGERGQGESFLINPFGLLYHEITASGLVKIDSEGEVLDPGSTNCGINKSGFVIHSAIHQSRKDAKCVIHIHDPATVAVASMKQGLLPLSMASALLGPVSYHDFEGISVNLEERERLAAHFPAPSKVLFLRNHGILCVGETVEEAFLLTFYATKACDIQIKAMAAGVDNLVLLDDDVLKQVYECEDLDTKKRENITPGMHEFEAWMRMLDAQGYRTGYVYRQPDIYNRTVQQPKCEARSPATMTSYRYEMLHGDNQTTPASRRARSQGKGNTYKNRAKWLNSPVKATEYRKEFIHDSHTEPAILKDSKPEKETVVKILEESKGPALKENYVQETITSSKPAEQVMSEIPLESIFNEEPTNEVFIEKGSNGGETKEMKLSDDGDATNVVTSTSTRVVTTSRTVVKSDGGAPVTTIEKKLIVNGEEQPVDSNLLSPPPVEVEVEEKEDVSEEGGDKDEGEGSGGKARQKVKKKRSFKKSFQGIMNRKSKSEKDDDDKK